MNLCLKICIIIIGYAQTALLIIAAETSFCPLEITVLLGFGSGSDRSRSGLTPPGLPCIFTASRGRVLGEHVVVG